jgi:uncharacterized membrane protein YqjE
MPAGPTASGGLLSSLRRLGGTAVGIAQVRLELLGTELEQEKLRVAGALALGAMGFMLLGVALLLACALVVLVVPPAYRLATLAALVLACALSGWLLMRRASARLRASEGAFALSLQELGRDRASLEGRE